VNRRAVDILVVVIALAWCVACVAMVLMGAGCKVYLPPCEPGTEETERAHPGGGVSVKLSELDGDGGEP
jgi:hypothetical protein